MSEEEDKQKQIAQELQYSLRLDHNGQRVSYTSAGGVRPPTNANNDSTWLRHGFMGWRKGAGSLMLSRATSARFNFCDTTLGGDFAINTAYQYTRFADLKARQDVKVGYGRGRFYSEQIADNAHDIHLRFGTQMFSSPLRFFLEWFDYPSYRMATTGRVPSILYDLGKWFGYGMSFVMPQIIAINMVGRLLNAATHNRFCYVKPAMPLYWQAYNNLVNAVSANMGMTMPATNEDLLEKAKFASEDNGANFKDRIRDIRLSTNNTMNELQKRLPGIYGTAVTGGVQIDMAKVGTRAQKLANRFNDYFTKMAEFKNGGGLTANGDYDYEWWNRHGRNAWREIAKGMLDYGQDDEIGGMKWSAQNYLMAYAQTSIGRVDIDANGASENLGPNESATKRTRADVLPPSESADDYFGNSTEGGAGGNGIGEATKAATNNGGEWISYRVTATETVSESFSNQTSESDIASTFNSFAKQKQKLMFNFAGGAMFGETLSELIHKGMDAIQGTLSGIGLDGLGGFFAGSMIDIPKTWDSSSVSLPKLSYTLKLRTPYGHPLAILQDLLIPVLGLIVGVAPLAHGQNGYGGPFYCELYDRGRVQIKMGLMTDVSITRGTSNVPWTRFGQPLGIDVTFGVTDLANVMSVPITTTSGVSDIAADVVNAKWIDKLFIGSDTPLDDYMMVLASMGLTEQIYATNRFKTRLGKFVRDYQSLFSADRWIGALVNNTPYQMFQWFQDYGLGISR